MRALPYTIVYLLPLSIFVGLSLGGWWSFLTPLLVFVAVPVADLLVGPNTWNPNPRQENILKQSGVFRMITWLAPPVQVITVLWGAATVASGELTDIEVVGVTISVGLQGGIIGINIAHELIHRPNNWERFLGKTLLCTVGYLHWFPEHVTGHHRWVATFRDPASARFGESFYRFFPRTLAGSFASAWNIEMVRLGRMGKSKWSLYNRILRFMIYQGMFLAAIFDMWGPVGAGFWFAQAGIAIWLLEAVNYLEHYGLLRKPLGDDRFEMVQPKHSWNSSERITNYFLFNLQRHSDHHAQPQRRYQILRHTDEAPQLPTGYAALVLAVMIPPLWFALMNPRIPKEMKRLYLDESGPQFKK